MKTIYFVAQIASPFSVRYNLAPSGLAYSRYIIDSLKANGYKVKILSVASSHSSNSYISKDFVDDKELYLHFFSFSDKNIKFLSLLNIVIIYIQLFVYIFLFTNKKSNILIYHYRGPTYLFSWYRKFVSRNYFYLIGEIFSIVFDKSTQYKISKELKSFEGGCGYILANDSLKNTIAKDCNNKVVCYGSYKLANIQNYNDDSKKIVYAGIISIDKVTDAFLAIEVGLYLPLDYHIHILGYGSSEDIIALNNRISKINNIRGSEIITYDGCLYGEEYEKFLSKCKYGLCTRTLNDDISMYCFPSKTLVYMAHGVVPVCSNLTSIRNSEISDSVIFVQGDLSAENVAKAIVQNSKEYETKQVIVRLNENFIKDIDMLFKKGNLICQN